MNWTIRFARHVGVRTTQALVGVVAVAVACGRSSSGPPGPPAPSDPLAGAWTGTLTDAALGSGVMQVQLAGAPPLNGTWSVSLGADSASGAVGELPLPPGGGGRYWALSCGTLPSQGTLILQSPTVGDVSGTYQSIGCGRLTSGTVRVAKR